MFRGITTSSASYLNPWTAIWNQDNFVYDFKDIFKQDPWNGSEPSSSNALTPHQGQTIPNLFSTDPKPILYFFLYSLFISKMNSSQNPMIELSKQLSLNFQITLLL